MKRIVVDGRELRTSSGRYVERLLHYLQPLDKQHSYGILLKPDDIDSWQPTSPNFEEIPCPHKEFTFAEQLALNRQINSLKPDLVHFTFPQQPILYKGKTITTIHDLTTTRFNNPDKNPGIFKLKQQIYKYVVKRVAHKSSAVIVPSGFVKDDVAAFTGINPNKIQIIYEAADPIIDEPEAMPGLAGKQFIVYIGRPTPHKNLERLIEAFIKLKAKHPELYLVLAGKKDANYSRVETDVHQRTIKNVVFTGYVSEGRLRWLYENCEAYVFPSLSEGFGLPGLEAMAHGAPVVSSNATCLPEIYEEAAHYFDPRNIQAMANAINEVLTNENLRNQLVKKGKSQVTKYSWKNTAQQTLDVYMNALDD